MATRRCIIVLNNKVLPLRQNFHISAFIGEEVKTVNIYSRKFHLIKLLQQRSELFYWCIVKMNTTELTSHFFFIHHFCSLGTSSCLLPVSFLEFVLFIVHGVSKLLFSISSNPIPAVTDVCSSLSLVLLRTYIWLLERERERKPNSQHKAGSDCCCCKVVLYS